MKKLSRILLINWLYFSKEIIEVGDVNFLTGKNGAGKSTVIDALQIVLLGETNARNFNQAANEKSQRTLDGYLRADMDENNPHSRRGKDFSTYIACEYQDDVSGTQFVTGVVFDCRSDGSRQDRFFIYTGGLPKNCFIEKGEAMDLPSLRKFLKENFTHPKIYDTQKEYRTDMLSRWNVHNEQALRMLKKAVSFRPIVDIQKFITENICDIPDKPDIDAMQQNIRDYKRHELLAQRQEEKLAALQEIGRLFHEMNQAADRWRIQSFLLCLLAGPLDQEGLDAPAVCGLVHFAVQPANLLQSGQLFLLALGQQFMALIVPDVLLHGIDIGLVGDIADIFRNELLDIYDGPEGDGLLEHAQRLFVVDIPA